MKSKEILPEDKRPPTTPLLGVFQKEYLIEYAGKCTEALIAAEREVQDKENEIQEDKESFLKTLQAREEEIHTHVSRVQELEKEIKEYKKLAKDNVPELVRLLKERKG